MILPKTKSTSHPCWICSPSRTSTQGRAGHTVTGMGKHLDAKSTIRQINFKENAARRNMTASTTDSSATRPSGRRWLNWDALKRSSLRWISLQAKTTLTSPPEQKLTSIVATGGFAHTWWTSIRCRQGINLISRRRCRHCTASRKRRTRSNMQSGHKVPPHGGNGNKLVGVRLWEFTTKMGWPLIERGNLCIQWATIHLRYESQQELKSKFFIVNISVTADGSLLSPTGV